MDTKVFTGLNAIKILDEGGWTRSTLKSLSGAHCALGAIAEAQGIDPLTAGKAYNTLETEEVGEFARAFGRWLANDETLSPYAAIGTVHRWNDREASGGDEVKAALRRFTFGKKSRNA